MRQHDTIGAALGNQRFVKSLLCWCNESGSLCSAAGAETAGRLAILLKASFLIALPVATAAILPTLAADSFDWIGSGISIDLVQSQISDKKCFSSLKYLQSCREAQRAARDVLAGTTIHWPDDKFDSMVAAVDQLSGSRTPKEWVMGVMLNAHLQSFDAHAAILPIVAGSNRLKANSNSIFRIGIKYLVTDAGVFVRYVTPNSPAANVGLKPLDRILRVDDEEVKGGMAGSTTMKKPWGRRVVLDVERTNQKLRLQIELANVESFAIQFSLIDFKNRTYAYTWVPRMTQNSCLILRDILHQLLPKASAVILDLRDNEGGLLDEALCIAELFLGKRKLVGTKDVASRIPIDVSYFPNETAGIMWRLGRNANQAFTSVPLVAIMNSNSASASEVILGALQDHKRAWLIGERSSGKGSVQLSQSMTNYPKLEMRFTTSYFFGPNGTSPQLVGVAPDFEVPAWRMASDLERIFLRERDHYPTSKEIKPTRTQTRSAIDRNALRGCLERSLESQEANIDIGEKSIATDYQMTYAVILSSCADAGRTPLPP